MPMNVRIRPITLLTLALIVSLGSSPWVTNTARADIIGFGNFSGFTLNQSDGGAAPIASVGQIHLTSPAFNQNRSLFYNTPQPISQFTASFTYQATSVAEFNTSIGGAAFVLQNTGPTAVQTILGDQYGYRGIGSSAEITFELYGGSATGSGYYTNGARPSGSPSSSPVSLTSGNPINVTIAYNGSLLQETLKDTVTLQTYSTSYFTNIPAVVGGATAYVGVAAGNGLQEDADQVFSNFQFTTVPEPSSLVLLSIGGVGLLAYLRRKYVLYKLNLLDHGRISRSRHRRWPVGFLQPRDAVPG